MVVSDLGYSANDLERRGVDFFRSNSGVVHIAEKYSAPHPLWPAAQSSLHSQC